MSIYDYYPYDPIFPQLFKEEKKRLQEYINDKYPTEHIGSTAVPGLGGKGIIDMCVIAPQNEHNKIFDALEDAGYIKRPDYKPSMHVSHTLYKRDVSGKNRKYHMQVLSRGSEQYAKLTKFRDLLRGNPDDVKRYDKAKRRAAREASQDKDVYMDIKSPVIEEILNRD